MNKTPIEWAKNPDGTQGYTWNPITGCLNGCPYCYARKLAYGRLRSRYLANRTIAGIEHIPLDREGMAMLLQRQTDPFYPRFWQNRIDELYFAPVNQQAKGIFVCDMGELFGVWIPREWQEEIFDCIKLNPQHRFYLLTKQPQNLIKFSPFPPNCYIGVSVTRNNQLADALKYLRQIEATVKFISFEPLLERINFDLGG